MAQGDPEAPQPHNTDPILACRPPQPPAQPTLVGQVSEVDGGAALAVRGPLQLHAHGDRGAQRGVPEGRRAEHDGDLAVNVGLGEGTLGLPVVQDKPDFYVI